MSYTTTTETGETTEQTDNITIGVPMFSRERALEQFLDSVPAYVNEVIVADNGEQQDRAVYRDDWPFELTVLHLSFDCGIGTCRHEIVAACDDPYLWIGDCDMEFSSPADLRTLKQILEVHPDLGGVAGWLREGETIRAGAKDLVHHDQAVIKTIPELPEVQHDPVPHARFEFIPQCGLFRTACFDDYSYDPEMYNSEHLDFFYGHKQTRWAFASTPTVLVQHHMDIDEEYRETKRGKNAVDFELMAEKWGFTEMHPGPRADWCTTRNRQFGEQLFDLVRRATTPTVWIPLRKLAKRGGLA